MLNSILNIFKKQKTQPSLKLRFVNGSASTCKGTVGLPTPFSTIDGEIIHVGDLVDVYDRKSGEKKWTNFACYSRNNSDIKELGKYVFYIMGMFPTNILDYKKPDRNQFFRISCSHKDLVHGSRYDLIHALEVDDTLHPETAYNRIEEERPVLKQLCLIADDGTQLTQWGVDTAFTDCLGRSLYAGDTVSVYDAENNYLGIHFVGKVPPTDPTRSNTKYDLSESKILGLVNKKSSYCPSFNCKHHRIELYKRFEEAQIGEMHSGYMVALPN